MDESEVLKFEQPVKTLRLSEAIRIGCRMKPKQCFEEAYSVDDGSCAIGAALDGYAELGRTFNRHFFGIAIGVPNWLISRVIAMNDRRRMSRERIADWLESKGY